MQLQIKSPALVGALMALAGVVAFSAKAVLVKMCYQYGVSTVTVLLLRMLFALPIYIGIVLHHNWKFKPDPVSRKDGMLIVLLGFLGYYMSSFLDFSGLQFIDASLERLILFVYPTIVVVISRFVLKKTISKQQIIAIAVTYVGIMLAFAGKLQFNTNSDTLVGASLVFACSFTYAAYLAGSGELIPRMGTVRFTAYAIIVSCVAVIMHYLLFEDFAFDTIPVEVVGLCLIMAVFSTVLPSFLISSAISKIGAPNVSIMGSVGPFSTIALAMVFLGETIDAYQIGGTIIVIGGIFLLNKKLA